MMKIMVLHTKYVTVFLNTQILHVYAVTKHQQMFDKKLKYTKMF